MTMRKIIHIDMDCFFAAIEMLQDPSLRDIPIAVGGRRELRSVISTANYSARRYGVRSAMPTSHALRLCPHLKVIPGRMLLYKEISQKIQAIFRRYTSLIEPLSLDEAYLDVSDTQLHQGSATRIAEEIRRVIAEEIGLTASAGVAPLKFLAKIASDMNKPNGQFVISPEEVREFIRQLPLGKIPGVGQVTLRRLQKKGLYVAEDIQQYDLAKLLQEFGKMGYILYQRCRGIDPRAINQEKQRKSVSVEVTLSQDITDWSECETVLLKLYSELEQRLRRVASNLTIARQGVKMKFADFQITTQEHVWYQLEQEDLLYTAKQIWQERRQARAVRLIGLHVTLRDPLFEQQLSFEW